MEDWLYVGKTNTINDVGFNEESIGFVAGLKTGRISDIPTVITSKVIQMTVTISTTTDGRNAWF